MLSVVPIKESSISSSYYLKQDGGYYIENANDKELYQWFGKGCSELGLVGEIDPRQHSEIYSGKLPNGENIGKKMADGSIKGRPGYDLTFSLNKDISLIICASKNKELSDYFLNAHINAVKTALNEIEKKVQARKTVNGRTEYETTKNMIASLCTHFSSRAGDAEVHTHVLVGNATKRMDGKWRALATDMSRKNGFFEMIRDNAVYFGSLYQNEIAVATKQIGFEVERIHKNGMFKITGFPEDLRDFFSKRRKQIESIIDTMNPAVKNNKKVYDQVAQHSKASKENINKADFFKKSRDDVSSFLKESGYQKTFDSVIDECLTKNKIIDGIYKTTQSAKKAIEDAISYLSQFNTTINANKILNKAMSFDLGANSHGDLYRAFESAIQSEKLVLTENGQYTSHYLLQREKNFIELIKSSKGSNFNNKYINITKNNKLSHKITDSLSISRFCIVNESLKQNDKKDFLLDLINDLESNKKSVKVVSLNKSAEILYNENQKNNQVSIWQRLKSIGKDDIATHVNTFIHQYAFESNLPLNKLFSKKGNEIFIVDQSDRMSFDKIQKLIDITKDTGANLIFLKNEAGLKNALSGNPISLIEKCNIPVHNAAHDISKKIRNEQVSTRESVNIISSMIGSKSSNKELVRHQYVLETVLDQNNKNLSDVAIVSYSRNSAEKLNLKLRDAMIQNQFVGGENKKIIVSEAVHLSLEEQKHVKFYPIGRVIKTYLGRGQYETHRVVRHDLNNNKLITQDDSKKITIFSPKEILKGIQNNHTAIVNEKILLLSTFDKIRVTKTDKFTDQLGFKVDHSYKVVSIGEKNIVFCDENNKTINVKHSKLNGLFLKYDYARSIYDTAYNNKKSIICDTPLYAINSNLISELKRNYSDINIITDDKEKAQKKIGSYQVKHNAIDLKKQGDSVIASPVEKAVDHAISVVGSREAAFTFEDIVEKSLSYKLANTSFKEIKNELVDRVNRNELFFRSIGNQVTFATKETIELEREIINKIKNGKNQFNPMVDTIKSKQYLESTKLTAGQKSACDLIATTKDRFIMVQGYAGTGKSTMLETLIGDRTLDSITVLLPKEVEILSIAPTHQAVAELEKRNIKSQTLKSLLVDYKKDEIKFSQDGNSQKLIIVDESSMISNSDFYDLQLIVEKMNARCVYLGDIAQLSAVESGKPSELAYIAKEADIATAIMSENLRQTNPTLKSIADLLMKGGIENFRNAFEGLEKSNLIIETPIDSVNKTSGKHEISPHILSLAKHYIAMPKNDRDETLIAASSNSDRIALNDCIRNLLQDQKELSKKDITLPILEDSRLSNTELLLAQNYKSGMVVKINGDYINVVGSDEINNTVTLSDNKNNISMMALSHMPKNSIVELYSKRNINLSPGEIIKFTKTVNEIGLKANHILKIISIDEKQGVINTSDSNNNIHKLDFDNYSCRHIDHGYCSTTHGLQGSTSKNILILLSSYNERLNTMKQLYVAVTRARENAFIFTDNKNDVKKQIIHNAGEKLSALEAMNLLEKRIIDPYKNKTQDQGAPRSVPSKTVFDAKEIENNLKANVKSIVTHTLGEPNHALSTSKNWRYGSHGALSIMVEGDKAGFFHNFETGEKGGMITLLMNEFGLSFKDALERASHLLGSKSQYAWQLERNRVNHQKPDQKFDSNKKQRQIEILIQKSNPIAGTVAERYLKNREISNFNNVDLRFLETVTTGSGNKDIVPISSALVAIARDENGKPQSLQLTYLDKNTATKLAGIPISKRTLNSLSGSCVDLSKNIKNPDITFIAEGIETALSIRDAAKSISNAQVIASLGKSNLPNLNTNKMAGKIILVLDNDLKNPFDDSLVKKAIDSFEKSGRDVVCIYPEAINNQKTDYNDLAKTQKFNQITRDIEQATSRFKTHDTKELKSTQKERYVDMEKEFLG